MENQTPMTPTQDNWKSRLYLSGAMMGAVVGFLSAYLFARSAQEDENGKPQPIPTGTLIGLLLSVMTLMRQIAESGKPKPGKKS